MTPATPCRYRLFLLGMTLLLTACSGSEGSGASENGQGVFARLELEAAFPEAFSFLSGVRERRDGTIMAADPLSQVLLQLDISAGTADTLGRVGEGPQEYMQPDQVFPLPGDSTLLVDIGKTRLTVVGPDGSLHSGMQMASADEDGTFTLVLPRFVDRQGLIYMSGSRGMEGPADSTEVNRFDRATEESVSLGWTWRPEPIVTRSGENVRMMSIQMAARDDWAAGPGGEFAIVRANGYSVEWFYPDGRTVLGPPTPYEAGRISDEDKREYLANRGSSGLMMMVSQSSDGGMEMAMSRGGGGMMGGDEEPNLRDFTWAEEFAPFRPDRSRISPEGFLWVERWLPGGAPPRMDVFDGEGVRVGSVDLPPDRQLIGFGHTAGGEPALYLVRTDEFDLRYLERYRLIR